MVGSHYNIRNHIKGFDSSREAENHCSKGTKQIKQMKGTGISIEFMGPLRLDVLFLKAMNLKENKGEGGMM